MATGAYPVWAWGQDRTRTCVHGSIYRTGMGAARVASMDADPAGGGFGGCVRDAAVFHARIHSQYIGLVSRRSWNLYCIDRAHMDASLF